MDLALLWEPDATIKGTADWLALHDFKMHHHIRGDADIERLARLMTGGRSAWCWPAAGRAASRITA